jgi:hypothetical protein
MHNIMEYIKIWREKDVATLPARDYHPYVKQVPITRKSFETLSSRGKRKRMSSILK